MFEQDLSDKAIAVLWLQDVGEGFSEDIPGVSEGLLPGFSKEAEVEQEGSVLPKQSEVDVKAEPASMSVSVPGDSC